MLTKKSLPDDKQQALTGSRPILFGQPCHGDCWNERQQMLSHRAAPAASVREVRPEGQQHHGQGITDLSQGGDRCDVTELPAILERQVISAVPRASPVGTMAARARRSKPTAVRY